MTHTGKRDFPLSLSHKALCLSPGTCYGMDSGVGSVFKCWEVGKKALPLQHQHHTDVALYFSAVSLAQSVQTWGFLLRALLSDMATSWPGATTPLDPSSHSWRHCSLQGLLSEQGCSCSTAKSRPLHETPIFISAERSSKIQMDNFKIFLPSKYFSLILTFGKQIIMDFYEYGNSSKLLLFFVVVVILSSVISFLRPFMCLLYYKLLNNCFWQVKLLVSIEENNPKTVSWTVQWFSNMLQFYKDLRNGKDKNRIDQVRYHTS